ncbi:unnamed protein product [Rhizoctonia solani]|uniref:BTB domain-containing protein n=1 Tax=Rhizoctonia solani TaxID=456999 RepID=A0A8H3D8C6_9AGAM|nr:unnamed protein product [Rhizoctonia solani]
MFSKLPRPESIEGTPVSVGAPSSTFSDIESVVSLSDQEHSDTDTTEDPNSTAVHPEFAFADGNIEIQTTDQTFWVHEYYINRFSVFATLIQTAKNSKTVSSRRITVDCDKKTKGEDLYNTLKVIYASHIDGIPNFDSNTIISTLRIASTYDYPNLRKFAISKLEAMDLPAIQRIQLSDEFLVPSFEIPAFTELCSRPEPISATEAEVLGITRFAEITRIRETQRTRWAVEVIKAINGNLLQTSNLVDSPQPESSDDDGSKSDASDSAFGHFSQFILLVLPQWITYAYTHNHTQNTYQVVHRFLRVIAA